MGRCNTEIGTLALFIGSFGYLFIASVVRRVLILRLTNKCIMRKIRRVPSCRRPPNESAFVVGKLNQFARCSVTNQPLFVPGSLVETRYVIHLHFDLDHQLT